MNKGSIGHELLFEVLDGDEVWLAHDGVNFECGKDLTGSKVINDRNQAKRFANSNGGR